MAWPGATAIVPLRGALLLAALVAAGSYLIHQKRLEPTQVSRLRIFHENYETGRANPQLVPVRIKLNFSQEKL